MELKFSRAQEIKNFVTLASLQAVSCVRWVVVRIKTTLGTQATITVLASNQSVVNFQQIVSSILFRTMSLEVMTFLKPYRFALIRLVLIR